MNPSNYGVEAGCQIGRGIGPQGLGLKLLVPEFQATLRTKTGVYFLKQILSFWWLASNLEIHTLSFQTSVVQWCMCFLWWRQDMLR